MQTKYLKPVLDSESPPTTVKVNGFTTVLSQPLSTTYKWNDKQKKVVDWEIHVGNFGHGMYDFVIHFYIISTKFFSAKDYLYTREGPQLLVCTGDSVRTSNMFPQN
jgi:hypothetical protein